MTAIWLIVVQWIASGLGGYLTGRLRTKWVGIYTHEVFFRDTAHGFLTWAVATVIGALVLAAATSFMVGGASRAAATVASGAAQGAVNSAQSSTTPVSAYDVDTLFRSNQLDADTSNVDARAETTCILANGLANGEVPATDRTYLSALVAARTGISEADAQKRVDEVIAQVKAAEVKARQAADTTRKGASAFSIFTALSMLIGPTAGPTNVRPSWGLRMPLGKQGLGALLTRELANCN